MKPSVLASMLLSFLTLPGIVLSGEASQYTSRFWRTGDGLPHNSVRAMAQTPDGYLWIGTDNGLARFDGG